MEYQRPQTPETSLGQLAFENYLKSPAGRRACHKHGILEDYQAAVVAAIQNGDPIPELEDASWLRNVERRDRQIILDPFITWLRRNQLGYQLVERGNQENMIVDFNYDFDFTSTEEPVQSQFVSFFRGR